MMSQLQQWGEALGGPAAGAAEQPSVNVVQLPSNAPSSGINVRTRAPVDVESPIKVSTPRDQLVVGNTPKH
jgi:hypothetical protein